MINFSRLYVSLLLNSKDEYGFLLTSWSFQIGRLVIVFASTPSMRSSSRTRRPDLTYSKTFDISSDGNGIGSRSMGAAAAAGSSYTVGETKNGGKNINI